jgi:hypothetical protein
MTSNRTIIPTVALLLALLAATPSVASANSLLSGYGGPGQGNQAILGASLLNGPSGGGGGGSSPSPPAVQSGSGSTISSGSGGLGPTPRQRGKRAAGRTRRGAATGGGGRGLVGETSGGAAGIYPASSAGGASQQAPGDSGAFGLSGENLLLILLVVGVLVCTGVLTRRLTPTPPGRKARSG